MPDQRSRTRWTAVAGWTVALLALLATPVAIGAGEGDPIRGGVRNPSPDQSEELRSETQIIANNSTYGTRQSNKGTGGGAIYGCRAARGAEPCVRANNLAQGRAFEFETDGPTAGSFTVGDPGAQPFTTNGTGRVENLHVDRADATDFAAIWVRMTAGQDTTVFRLGPLRVAVSCDANANPTLSANTTAQDAVIHSVAHATAGAQEDNRTSDADFDQGETHVMGFGPSHSGTITYIDQEGSVAAQILTQRLGDDRCVIGGSAQGGPNLER